MENPYLLGPIAQVKSRDVLVDRLRQQILSGVRIPGIALPAERELVEDTGLSRNAIRDALRILEGEGLIETRPGRYGGSIVRQPDGDALSKPIEIFVRGRRITLQALIEARVALEPTFAELAAERRSPADINALRQLTEELELCMTDVPRFLDANVRWYLALVEAAGNDLLRAFYSSIAELILEETGKKGMSPEDTRRLIAKSHRRVFEAVESGDPAAARRRMERHVRGYADHFYTVSRPENSSDLGVTSANL